MKKSFIIFLMAIGLAYSCSEDKQRSANKAKSKPQTSFTPVSRPASNGDSAYKYVEKQVSFGPRVPGMKSHSECADYLRNKMASFGWSVQTQRAEVKSFDGKTLPIQNIISTWNKSAQVRILLFAHWDTRPFADRDDSEKSKPIMGANDGASGVAVLMDIARVIGLDSIKPNVGIDIIFFDAEDYGQPSGLMGGQKGETWCLGSQYWGNNLHEEGYKAEYGILLDMVGASNAVFPREAGSLRYNPQLVDKVWYYANNLGYNNYFINEIAYGGVLDDHVYVSTLAKIPAIDIIHYDPIKKDFGPFHHRHTDDLSIIDPKTLEAVGNVVLETIYRE